MVNLHQMWAQANATPAAAPQVRVAPSPSTTHQHGLVVGAQVYYGVRVGKATMQVACTVTGTKLAYGSVLLQIAPQAGSGSIWVQASSVTTR